MIKINPYRKAEMSMNTVKGGLSKKLQNPGELSIVVQGGVFESNIVEVANICTHWRQLFPRAEIICTISSSNVFVRGAEDIRLTAESKRNWLVNSAFDLLKGCCDLIAFSEAALPFPPNVLMRTDSFNANLQLVAAKKGLSLAKGRYVLRIRNDAFFADDSFVDQYEESNAYPRRNSAVLAERVLIASTFTINPYGMERYPFHFGDWFHFGLLEDVKKIWSVPAFPLRDIFYYKNKPHAPGSRDIERNHHGRVTFEQHMIYEGFKTSFPEMKLEHHNDVASRELSIDILLDNFAICDQKQANFVFEKYKETANNWKVAFWSFVTRQDWQLMVGNRDLKPGKILHRPWGQINYEEGLPFPRNYSGNQLSTGIGVVLNGEIALSAFAEDKRGVLMYGPYITLRRGSYVAEVVISTLEAVNGVITLRATLDHGKICLAEKTLPAAEVKGAITLPFSIASDIAHNFEVVVEVRQGIYEMAIERLTVHRQSSNAPAASKKKVSRIPETLLRPSSEFSDHYGGTSMHIDPVPHIEEPMHHVEEPMPHVEEPDTSLNFTKEPEESPNSAEVGRSVTFIEQHGLEFAGLPTYFRLILSVYSIFLGKRLANKMKGRTNLFFRDAKSWSTIVLGEVYKNISAKRFARQFD